MKTFSKATNRLIPATLFQLQFCWNIFPQKIQSVLDLGLGLGSASNVKCSGPRRKQWLMTLVTFSKRVKSKRGGLILKLLVFLMSVLRLPSHLTTLQTTPLPSEPERVNSGEFLKISSILIIFLPRWEAWSASERSVWERRRCKGDGACTDYYYSGGALAQAQHKTATDREVVTSNHI